METVIFNILLKKAKYDKKSFDELYSFYYPRIIRRLEIKYGRPLAEDCAQEFFMAVIDRNKSFGYVKYPASWVYKCCENLAKRKIAGESKYLPVENIGETAAVPIYRLEQRDEVKRLLSGLDEEVKKIIYLVYYEGYSLKEVSSILNISYTAVRQKYSRTMKKLKKLSQKGREK